MYCYQCDEPLNTPEYKRKQNLKLMIGLTLLGIFFLILIFVAISDIKNEKHLGSTKDGWFWEQVKRMNQREDKIPKRDPDYKPSPSSSLIEIKEIPHRNAYPIRSKSQTEKLHKIFSVLFHRWSIEEALGKPSTIEKHRIGDLRHPEDMSSTFHLKYDGADFEFIITPGTHVSNLDSMARRYWHYEI
jgi:hypothetical protein